MLKRRSLEYLMSRPTIYSSHFADLKLETKHYRVWLSRMKVADGATCDNMVTVERFVPDTTTMKRYTNEYYSVERHTFNEWIVVDRYEAKKPMNNLMNIKQFKKLLKTDIYNGKDVLGETFRAWYTTLLKQNSTSACIKETLEHCINDPRFLNEFSGRVKLLLPVTNNEDIDLQLCTWSLKYLYELTLENLYKHIEPLYIGWYEVIGSIHNKYTGEVKLKAKFLCRGLHDKEAYYNISESVAKALDFKYDKSSKSIILASYSPYDTWSKISMLLFNDDSVITVYEQR